MKPYNQYTTTQPIAVDTDRLSQLVHKAQQHSRNSKQRRMALAHLIRNLQQSNLLDSWEQCQCPSEIYQEALAQTYCQICYEIEEYDERKVTFTVWANQILHSHISQCLR